MRLFWGLYGAAEDVFDPAGGAADTADCSKVAAPETIKEEPLFTRLFLSVL